MNVSALSSCRSSEIYRLTVQPTRSIRGRTFVAGSPAERLEEYCSPSLTRFSTSRQFTDSLGRNRSRKKRLQSLVCGSEF